MRDLAFVGFLFAFFLLSVRRPFLFVLGYAYIDIVSPQILSYYLLHSVPISLIFFAGALIGWLIGDKSGTRFAPRQGLMLLLLVWAGWTTFHADFPLEALDKWDWVWKSLVFAIFLPFTLRTRLRMEALLTIMILSAASIIINGGIKTLASGGGYGVLNLGINNNSGLYEGSIISTLAIAIIPFVLYLGRFSTIFPPSLYTRAFCYGLIFACLLIPIGTEARTGLICIAVLAIVMLRDTRRRLLYLSTLGACALIAIPFLPASFTQRMDTIEGYQQDKSASTRLAVWGWTWNYVQDHPFGGGFEAYRQNSLSYQTQSKQGAGGATVRMETQTDAARAYHSSYFEMLGEQGWPGFLMWLSLHGIGLFRMEILRRRYRKAEGDQAWIAPFATALQSGQLIYLVGSLFLGIAFQSFVYMWIGLQIALDGYCARARRGEDRDLPFRRPAPDEYPATAA